MAEFSVFDPHVLRRFPPGFRDEVLERRYRSFLSTAALARQRAALCLAIVMYLGFSLLDRFLEEPHVNVFLAIRFAFAVVLAISLVLTFRGVWRGSGQLILSCCLVLGSLGISVMIFLAAHETTKITFFAGSILVVMVAGGFGMIRTLACLFASTASILTTIIALAAVKTDPGLILADTAFLCSAVLLATVSSYLLDISEREAWQRQQTIGTQVEIIAAERARADDLLVNVLPGTVAERLKNGENPIADSFEDVTVLFADVENFTPLADRIGPASLVNLLDELFSAFDLLAQKFGVEKVKTIGDAYMAVCGAPLRSDDHAERIVRFAFAILQVARDVGHRHGHRIEMRIGINTGPAVAGVIGKHRIIYDLWGDTVNVASRLEGLAEAGSIVMGGRTYGLIQDFAEARSRAVTVKGKGEMAVYEISGRQSPQFGAAMGDGAGRPA